MRIAFDVSYIQRRRAGIGRFSAELLNAVLDADRENEYLLFGWSFSLDSQKIASYIRPNVHLRLARVPGGLRRFYFARVGYPNLRFLVGEFDVFHSSDPLMPPLAGQKAVISVYDLAYRHFPAMFEPYVLRLDRHVRRAIRCADAIIVPSEFTRADLLNSEELDDTRVHVIHPLVSARTRGGEKVDREVLERHNIHGPYVLTVGTIEPRKNHINLIRAFEELGSEEPDLQLVIAGKLGWHYSEAVAVMNSSPLARRIHFLEYVSDAELDALYRGAVCVVYPSFFEGGGLPVLEAMMAGTPVITSNTSAMKEVGKGAALLIDPHDPDEVAGAILRVLRDTDLAQDLARKGCERVKLFSPAAAAEKVLRLYQKLA